MASSSFGYFDESGKFKDSDFICIAGFVSDDPHWEHFCEQWHRLLQDHKLSALHTAELTKEDRDKVLPGFIDVIRRNIQIGFGIGFDAECFRSMSPEFQMQLGEPQYFCFQRMLRTMVQKLKQDEKYDGPVPITFDDTEEHAVLCYRMWSKLRKKHSDLRQAIPAITFADDSVLMQLQAADLLANQTRASMLRRMRNRPPTEHFVRLMTPIEPHFHTRYYEEVFQKPMLEEFAAKFSSGEIALL